VKRGKNDAADAEAICEAVARPTMRFVPVKTAEQQSVLVLHRTRDLLIRQRTMLANSLRAHCAEFGIVVAQGMAKLAELLARIADEADTHIPSLARGCLLVLGQQLQELREPSTAGIARTRSAAAWRPSPASAQSPPVRWPSRSPTPRSSAQAAISRRGSGSCPDRTRVAVRSARRHFKARGPLYPALADQRCPRCASICKAGSTWLVMGHRPPTATPVQACGRRSRQQDSADRLGTTRPRRDV